MTRMRLPRIPYSAAEMQWLADNKMMVISDYHQAFCAAFGRSDVTAAHLHGLRKRLGWKVGRAHGRLAGRRRLFSPAEVQWLRENCTLPPVAYLRDFRAAFSRDDITSAQIKTLRKAQGWKTGRTGRYEKGAVPSNKGKKMPFNENSARTQFKKGGRTGVAAEIYKPIGTECVRDGYLVRKIHDGLPMQSRWRAVHLLNWEDLHGSIPDGMVLKCKGDKANSDPSNWELVPRGVLPRLNGKSGRDYDRAPAELKPTIMAVAKLEHGLSERRKQQNTSRRPKDSDEAAHA
jgi:hypothetical protein